MLTLLFPILTRQEVTCDKITTHLKFREPISLTCTGLSQDQSYKVRVTGSDYPATLSNSNTLTFKVTEVFEIKSFALIQDRNTIIYRQDVIFESNPIMDDLRIQKPVISGRWSLINPIFYFGSRYYGTGEDKVELAISDNRNENSFDDNMIHLYDNENCFIPGNLPAGDYYLFARIRYIDGETTKVSKIIWVDINVQTPSIKSEFSVMLSSDKSVFNPNKDIWFYITAAPSVPHFKIMWKFGEYSTDLDQYTQWGDYQDPVDYRRALRFEIKSPNDITDIQNGIVFISIDTKTSEILNYTEINNVRFLPFLILEGYQIDQPKYNDEYVLQEGDLITGTISFKNEISIEHMTVSGFGSEGTIYSIPNENKKIRFELLKKSDYPSVIDVDEVNARQRIILDFYNLDMSININKNLPFSGIIQGNIKIKTNIGYRTKMQFIAKFGEFEADIQSYNFNIVTRSADRDFTIDLGDKIKYDVNGTLPSRITFAIVIDNIIMVHKSADFSIFNPQLSNQ
ncbi:hypothetical protein TVAG_088500 [Trichomonas vaginalis G3]|uniref:Uncharacterized protein n=1 Tax=Trichomonas vaginalis (strain ATCC PRA-98 / G3) TaxID=412133 RepID=A2EAZ5_TRIV3|nr:hypothetical protein TVAGG3_0398180 [Trichomonas vaginalis G3]EAY10135.1 hypothetical protein TVAG_088500 [Trichomonas vaginalis G3]KAI5534490.1 hypothetical protein TVAGG3_0398180 [Trichomonas vaginalis G3]|eukprot:XP_001322358.1 hypothetical protein [Trichomonas vaginalis G3]